MMGSDDSGYGSDSFVLKHDNIIYIKFYDEDGGESDK
jgi:hypothetical protein